MNPETVGLIGLAVLLILLAARLWVGFALIVVGFLGYLWLGGASGALNILGLVPYSQMASYVYSAIPLFILMGTIISVAEMGEDLFASLKKWLGHIRGGLAMATAAACGVFASVCGDAVATAVTMGKVSYPEMKRYGYSDKLAAPVIIAGGSVGIIIPPSIGFIIYGIFTEQSIGKLFMAGFIPGIIQVFFYIMTIYILCKIDPTLGPAAPRARFREMVVSTYKIWPVVIIFLLIILGIYLGVFTPTEAAAIGSFGALVLGLFMRRLNIQKIYQAALETAENSSVVFLMMIGVFIFSRFIAKSNLPVVLSELLVNLEVPDIVIILAIIATYIVLGCFLDILPAILLTLPIFFPAILALGYDPIWWGVITVRVLAIGIISPPFGLVLFAFTRIAKLPIGTLFRGMIPFVIADTIHVILLAFIPELSLFLPRHM